MIEEEAAETTEEIVIEEDLQDPDPLQEAVEETTIDLQEDQVVIVTVREIEEPEDPDLMILEREEEAAAEVITEEEVATEMQAIPQETLAKRALSEIEALHTHQETR